MRSLFQRQAFFILAVLIFTSGPAIAASADSAGKTSANSGSANQPVIKISELAHDFGQVLESTVVEHVFSIKNTGTAVLNIDQVRTDWGCTVAHFDRAIPPGGEGNVTLKVNLRNYSGKTTKTATVHSDDRKNPKLTLKMEGVVLPLIDVKPSMTIIFRGMANQAQESVLDLSAGPTPFHISSIESNLDQNIEYKLETVEDGKHYRLRVSNKTSRGNYAGFIKMHTDLAQKPELLFRVNGYMEGDISVKPQTVLIGKLSANQPERQGRVTITSNRNKPFQITRLEHDERLVSVVQHPLENGSGYVIEINPKLEAVPVGSRQQTALSIETDVSPDQKDVVQIHLFNSAQPEAKTAPK